MRNFTVGINDGEEIINEFLVFSFKVLKLQGMELKKVRIIMFQILYLVQRNVITDTIF